MRTQFILIPVVLLATSVTQARNTPDTPPTPVVQNEADEQEVPLEELIRLAQLANPRISIARENLASARERLRSLRAIPSPTLQLVPGFTGTSTSRDEEVILSQKLDVFGLRRARASVGAANFRRAEADNTLAGLSLIIDVRNAATALFAAQEAEKLERAQVEISQTFRNSAVKRAALGDVPPVQVQRADIELLRAQTDLSNASAERLSGQIMLNLLTGLKPDQPLRVALPLDSADVAMLRTTVGAPTRAVVEGPPFLPSNSPVEGISASAVRPDIMSARSLLEAREAESLAVRRESLPSIELQARRSAFFGRDGSYALRAVVTLPILDFGALKGERRAAEAQVRAQRAAVDLLRQQAAAQVQAAQIRLEQNRRNVARYREQLVPLTLDLLRKTQIGYAQGASSYLEVLEAQRTLRQVQSEYLQVLVSAQNSQTVLDAARFGGVSHHESQFDGSDENAVTRGAAQ